MNPADDEDLALSLNGRKKKIRQSDFVAAFTTLQLNARQQENMFKKMDKSIPQWIAFIDNSFLNDEMKIAYKEMIIARQQRLLINKN